MADQGMSNPPSRDEVFIQDLRRIVIGNLQNEQFGVSDLCHQAGYSRSQLHRKLKVLVKKSASHFIRDIRLEEAMILLQNDTGTVSEIAFQVGFGSAAYFNKCFHQRYGCTPGEVRKRVKEGGGRTTRLTEKNSSQDKTVSRPSQYHSYGQALILIGVFFLAALLLLQISHSPVSPPVSLAVLPLDNLSAHEENEYFAEGMHDALIGALGKLEGLRVISRTSTLPFETEERSIKSIAKELGVQLVIEGSVYGYEDSVRIQLQLIKALPEETHLWAKEYHQAMGNVLKMHGQVVTDVAQEINLEVTGEEESRLASIRSVNTETYRAYLRGMYYLNKSTPEDFHKGMDYLQEAIEHDPGDAMAYAGLALGYTVLGHGPDPPALTWQRGRAAALRAIKLDSSLAEAHAALAFIKTYFEGDWKGAELAFKRANAINPSLAMNHFHYAWYLVLFGKMEEAVIEHHLAKELDPLTVINTADLGSLYCWTGQFEAAIIEIKQALELDPDFGHAWWSLGNAYAKKDMFEEAITAHQRAMQINPVWKWALCNTYVLAGRESAAREILRDLKSDTITPRIAFGLAMIHTTLGEVDDAFQWLNHQPPDTWVPWVRTWPDFETLRQDDRFDVFLEEKNLPPISKKKISSL